MPGEEYRVRNGSREEEERKVSDNLDVKHRPLDGVTNRRIPHARQRTYWRRLVHDVANPRI